MLERQHVQDTQVAISVAPETDVNTPYDEASEFETIICDQVLPVEPEPELMDDSDQVGDGVEGPKDPRPGETPATPLTLSSKLNNVWNARIMARFQGGNASDADNLVATGVYDHLRYMQPRTSRIPKLSTIPMLLGGADPILSSMAVNEISISQQGTESPQFSSGLLGSGHFRDFRDVYRVQVVTITGSPAGGNFKLTYDGQETADIAHNANAATVLAALEALSNIAVGDISVTGGPGPGTPYVVTFLDTGTFLNADVELMTASHTFTGGSGPAIAVTPQTAYLVLPSPPSYVGRYMHPVALVVTLNDGSAVTLNDKGLLSHTLQMTQNVEWTSLPGITQFRVSGDKRSGTYMGLVSRGERQIRPSFDLYLDSAFDERYWKRKNLSITSLKFKHQGERIGSTAYYHEFEIEIPLAKPMALSVEQGGNWGVKRLSLLPVWNSGFVIFRSRDGNATLT